MPGPQRWGRSWNPSWPSSRPEVGTLSCPLGMGTRPPQTSPVAGDPGLNRMDVPSSRAGIKEERAKYRAGKVYGWTGTLSGDGLEGELVQVFTVEERDRSMPARSVSHWPATSEQGEEATRPHRACSGHFFSFSGTTKENQSAL